MANNYWKAKMMLETSKKRWLKVNPNLPNESGIYILTRLDENGFKYAYVGQAVSIINRLAQHLIGYQHIDLSLKKHKLYDKDKNPYGWQVDYFLCLKNELDNYEQEYILRYANMGYQMRNKTIGSQSKGKAGLDDNKASKGYYDGLKQGRKNALKEVKEYFDKYLDYNTKTKPECYKKRKLGELPILKEIYIKKFQEFGELINDESLQD